MLTNPWAANRMRLILTDECNIGCFYCHNEGQEKGTSYMSGQLINHIAELLSLSGEKLESISYSGGEPLLHPDLSTYVRMLNPFAWNHTLVTNGILLHEETINILKDAGLSKIRLGVDSITRPKSRPTPGGANDRPIIETIELIVRSGLRLEINTVLTKYNVREIVDIVKLCARIDASAKFFEHVEVGSFGSGTSNASLHAEPIIRFDDFHKIILKEFPNVSHGPSPEFGDANYCYSIDGRKFRYCRYLCPYGLCYLTGTRIDAQGYAYACMGQRGRVRIDAALGVHESLRRLYHVGITRCGRFHLAR